MFTQAEIEALLDKVCAILPANLSQTCDSLVQQYGPLIVQLLLAELQPDRVCTVIGLCTAKGKGMSTFNVFFICGKCHMLAIFDLMLGFFFH